MTIKITEQNNQILVRRWKYSTERKRSLPVTLYSVSKNSVPSQLPDSVITEHKVGTDEQQIFIDFVTELKVEQDKTSAKVSLWQLTDNLNRAKDALVDPELKSELTLEQYEELSETVNDIKKLITKNKNTLKRKTNKKAKATTFRLYNVSHEPHTSGSILMDEISGTTESDALALFYSKVEAYIVDMHKKEFLVGIIYACTHFDVIDEYEKVIKKWDARDVTRILKLKV